MVSANRHGLYRAELADGTVLCLSRQPFLDGARALIAAGFNPGSVLIGWMRDSTAWALSATLGRAAKLTVDETRTCFARWKAFSSSAVGPQRRLVEGGAILPPDSGNASPGSPHDETALAGQGGGRALSTAAENLGAAELLSMAPNDTSAEVITTTKIFAFNNRLKSGPVITDPPPRRRSPRTASARALSTLDNAAAGSKYAEEAPTSSQARPRIDLSNGSARKR
ncbi:hypothetical protein WDM22_22640 [Bradyrhizobium septentrionale]|uniref:hypothetical protein n=1 Tax=Bradyrhizobium septentrionale TaxID=1404411 RepID=UPI0030CE3EC7